MAGREVAPARLWAALGCVYILWGSTYLGILIGIRTIPVFMLGALRFLVAGALLYAWSIRRGEARIDRPTRRQWVAAALVAIGLFVIGNTGVAWAETRVSSGVASLVIATVPLWMALFDRIACGQRLSRLGAVGLVVGFGGVALLAGPSGEHIDVVGVIVLVFSAAGWAAASLYSRRAPQPRRQLVSSSMQMLIGGGLLLVIALAHGDASKLANASAESWGALAYLIVFGSIVAFTAYTWLLRVARTSLVATYAYVNPLVALLLGWGFENEPVGGRTLAAGGLILVAVALIVTPGRSRKTPAAVAVRAR